LKQLLRIFALVLAVSLAASSFAQGPITLVPFNDPAYGVEGLLPEGWAKAAPGIYMRGESQSDSAVLAVQAAPLSADELFTALLPQFGLTEVPDVSGETETDAFAWSDYAFEVESPLGALALRLSLAERDGTTYLVLLQASPDEVEALSEAVFEPVREALRPTAADEEPVPYIVEEVTFENGDVTLAGTLTLPEGDGPHPAVALMTGSGPQTRDEIVVPGFPIFELIADHLTRHGIAVLRYDDRGVGESTGDYQAASVQDLASDGQAAVAYLRSREEINADQVGVLGHSEGGIYAAMLGADPDSGVAFIVSLAGTAVNGLDMLKEQNRLIMAAAGLPEDVIDTQLAYLDSAYPLVQARDWDGLEQLTYDTTLEQWDLLSEEEQAGLGGDAEAYARQATDSFMAGYAAEWFATLLEYDPGEDWARTTVPVLAIFGGKDTQVSAAQNLPAMESALVAADNQDFEIVTLPEANHLFQTADTGGLEEYGTLPPAFTPDLLPTISDWLLERVTVAE
jgi:uncharacterized protein